MSFELKKIQHLEIVGSIEANNAFEVNGEIFIRLNLPDEYVKVDKGTILAISIETWQIEGFSESLEVQPYIVTAKAVPDYKPV